MDFNRIGDGLMGLGPMIVTIMIVLIIRLCGGAKEPWETKFTRKQYLKHIMWVLILATAMIFAFTHNTLK